MFVKITMFEPLLEAFPEFAPLHAEFRAEWQDEPDDPPNYLLLARLAKTCAELLRDQRLQDLRAILAVAERWLLEGDHYVWEATTVGFLEDLQSELYEASLPQAAIFDLLGPEARYWWVKVEEFWTTGKFIVDDRV